MKKFIFLLLLQAIMCSSAVQQERGSLRLVSEDGMEIVTNSRETNVSGWLQIYNNGSWDTICFDEEFEEHEAQTACNQLGDRHLINFGSFMNGTMEGTVRNLICPDEQDPLNTTLFASCNYTSQTNCSHSCDVYVSCSLSAPPEITSPNRMTLGDVCYRRSMVATTSEKMSSTSTADMNSSSGHDDLYWLLIIPAVLILISTTVFIVLAVVCCRCRGRKN